MTMLMFCISFTSGCSAKVTNPDPPAPITPQPQPKVLSMTSTFSSPESGTWTIGGTVVVKTTVTVQILWDDPQGVIPQDKLPDFSWFPTLFGNVVGMRSLEQAPKPTFSVPVVKRISGTTGGTATFTVGNWAGCNWGAVSVINPVPCYDTASIELVMYTPLDANGQHSRILSVPGAAQVKLSYMK